MRDFSHVTIYRKPGRRRRGHILPVLLLLLGTLLALVLTFLVFGSLGIFAPKAAPGLRAVELDTASEALLSAASSGGELPAASIAEAIDEMLDQVEAMDGDTLLWTGRDAEGSALFRVKSKDGLTFAPGLAESDTLFSRCDPARELAEAAGKRGMALLLLPTSESGEALSIDRLSEIHPDVLAAAKKYGLRLAVPEAEPDTGLTLYHIFDSRLADTGLTFARSDESPARLLTLLDADAGSRIILGRYSSLSANPSIAVLLARHALSGEGAAEALPDLLAVMGGRSISQELALAYPSTAIYTDTCFLMGTSDPALPLSIRGGTIGEHPVTVERYGTQGVWGMLVSLSEGENEFTLTQEGGKTLTFTVERRQYTSSGGSEVTASDGTVPAVWGQQVRVTGAACISALSDYTNADTITATFYQGATVSVYDSVRSLRAGKKTYYYQLANGSYIPAWAVELLDVDTPAPVFEGMEVGFDQDTNCTTITFRGGTPAVTHQWEGNALALTFLTAQYEGDIPVPDRFITEYSAENAADGLSFTLGLRFAADDPLYGWSVSYDTEANTTTVYLKHQPQLSSADTGPLTGVRVLLDAGHGGDDNGAMGSAGLSAPLEKDVNLAEALAARRRLEELGATVLLVREDDTFFTLDERLNMVRDLRPDIFIALHHNSAALVSDINNHGGTEAYWFYTEGKALAESLVNGICCATGRARRGAFYNYYYVTRSNICPSVLLESGFMTDPAEYETCADPATLWDEAGAIALSVLDHIASLG